MFSSEIAPSRGLIVLGFFVLAMVSTACGGGGGDGSGPPITLYVRASGNDGNTGEAPESALRSIRTAVLRARGGDTIIVGPGRYTPPAETAGIVVDITAKTASPRQPLLIRADPTGASTGDSPGNVEIDSATGPFGFRLTGSSGIVIDGFVIVGGRGTNTAGIQVRSGSSDVIVRNCEIRQNLGDGIRIEASNRAVVLNNLIWDNGNRGVQVSGGGTGSDGTRIVNNTVASNGNDGISIGGGVITNTFLRNNLIVDNVQRGIDTDGDATRGYDADYNLVFPTATAYGILTPKGLNDLSVDPLLIGGFRLAQIASGQGVNSAAVNAGDPATAAEFRTVVSTRTTATDERLDLDRLDIGYHYLSSFMPPPTATPIMTQTGAPATPLATPTPFPPGGQLFVRATAGNNENNGSTAALAFRTIKKAVDIAGPGTQIVVGPGAYSESVILSSNGTPDRPIFLRGDPSGRVTGDPAGPVILALSGSGQGIFVDGGRYWVVDGFTVSGAGVGIHVRRDARGTIVRHNEVLGSTSEGILVQDTSDVTIFDNLIYCNGQAGIRLTGASAGSPRANLINNTVVANGNRGIFIGTANTPSENAFLRNNLIQDNCRGNLQVDSASATGFDGGYNLVSPPTYTGVDAHPTDTAYDPITGGTLDRPAKFVERAFCESVCATPDRDAGEIPPQPVIELHPNDFRLAQTIAGQNPPNSLGVDGGDPTLAVDLRARLNLRTTASNDEPDGGRVDIGAHFPG